MLQGLSESTVSAGINPAYVFSSQGPYRTGAQIKGRYEIQGVLGLGPLGTVYKALDNVRRHAVALKVFNEDLLLERRSREGFATTLRQLGSIRQSNLTNYIGAGSDGLLCFTVCELSEHLSLRYVIARRQDRGQTYGLTEAIRVVLSIAHPLNALHRFGAHGGIKPENILLLPNGVKFTDFAIQRTLPPHAYADAQRLVRTARAYLAPEIDERGGFDGRADIYGLAALIFEMVTGDLLRRGDAERMDELLPYRLARVLEKALARDPEFRYPNMDALIMALHAALDDLSGDLAIDRPTVRVFVGEPRSDKREANVPVPATDLQRTSQLTPAMRRALLDEYTSAEIEDDNGSRSAQITRLVPTEDSTEQAMGAKTERMLVPSFDEQATPVATNEEIEDRPTSLLHREMRVVEPESIVEATADAHFVESAMIPVASVLAPEVLNLDAVPTPIEDVEERRIPTDQMRRPRHRWRTFLVLAAVAVGLTAGILNWLRPWAPKTSHIEPVSPTAVAGSIVVDEEEAQPRQAVKPRIIEFADAERQSERRARSAPPPEEIEPQRAAAIADLESPNCPHGMKEISVGVRRYCIDRFEAPGRGHFPVTGISLNEAMKACYERGLRLCTAAEWGSACDASYPYGTEYEPGRCNTEGEEIVKTGSRLHCRSALGIFDLSGNASEWVAEGFVIGGDFTSRGQLASCRIPGQPGFWTGYRCCGDLD